MATLIRSAIRHSLLVLLATAAPATAHAQEQGQYREFRGWMAACDNTRSCRALALPMDAEEGVTLRIDRAGDPEAAPRLFIVLTQGLEARPGTRITIASQGKRIATVAAGRGLTESEGDYEITDRQAVDAVLAELRRAPQLRITLDPVPGGADGGIAPVSLDGASAALLWIDDRQKRVGTVTALVRPGTQPASAVPTPLVPPRPQARAAVGGKVSEHVPQAVMAAFRNMPGDTCDKDDRTAPAATLVRLGPGVLLAGVSCWRGAYNVSAAYFIVEEGPSPRVRPASFPRPAAPSPDGDPGPDNILTNADYDKATGVIRHVAKGRGMGDCGETASWAWDGTAFRPLSLTAMPVCRGLTLTSWFALYRTR